MNHDQLQKLREGDRALFAELVKDHHRALVALATPIVGVSEAEEVVQNAWVKAYKTIAGFEGRSRVRTWLGRIVINEAKLQLRSRKRESLFGDMAGESESSDAFMDRFAGNGSWQKPPVNWHVDSPDSLLMSEELAECLERLLDAMSTNQRALLEMRDGTGLPFEEICNELSISASNARVLLHRARGRLFNLVDHYQETGEC